MKGHLIIPNSKTPPSFEWPAAIWLILTSFLFYISLILMVFPSLLKQVLNRTVRFIYSVLSIHCVVLSFLRHINIHRRGICEARCYKLLHLYWKPLNRRALSSTPHLFQQLSSQSSNSQQQLWLLFYSAQDKKTQRHKPFHSLHHHPSSYGLAKPFPFFSPTQTPTSHVPTYAFTDFPSCNNKLKIHENNENSAESLNDHPTQPIEHYPQEQVETTLFEENDQQVLEKLIETLKFNLYYFRITRNIGQRQSPYTTNSLLWLFLCWGMKDSLNYLIFYCISYSSHSFKLKSHHTPRK